MLRKCYLGISDDDLCASCVHLAYDPGNLSICLVATRDWPATFNEDGYSVACLEYSQCKPGSNVRMYPVCPVCGSPHGEDLECPVRQPRSLGAEAPDDVEADYYSRHAQSIGRFYE